MATSGEKTLEYRKVRVNYKDIVEAIEANKEAAKSVRRHLVQLSWITAVSNVTVDEHMTVVLNKIYWNPQEYAKFIEILGKTVGLDHIKKAIEETVCESHCVLCVCLSLLWKI